MITVSFLRAIAVIACTRFLGYDVIRLTLSDFSLSVFPSDLFPVFRSPTVTYHLMIAGHIVPMFVVRCHPEPWYTA